MKVKRNAADGLFTKPSILIWIRFHDKFSKKTKGDFLMIHILGVAGSPVKEGNTEALLKDSLDIPSSDPEVKKEIFSLSGLPIAGCKHCNWCLRHQTLDKFCAISDGMDDLYPALVKADVVVLATPVHIGRMSGLMANMLDRLRVFVYGNIHRGELKDKVGVPLIVAFLRHGGLETTLSILNSTFAVFNMLSVGRGGLALSSVDGKGKTVKGIRHMVLEDGFGLSSAKEAVRRGVELAKIIQAGKKALNLSPGIR
jgi:multimeric flavodoxin WrbA